MAKIAPTTAKAVEANIQDHYINEIQKKRHNCTDVICLILFLIFVLAQIALSLIIYTQGGDPRNLVYPHDSNGNLCTDSTPNLFYFNLAECVGVTTLVTGCSSPTKCVATCPDSNQYYLIDSQRAAMFSKYCIQSSLNSYYNGSPPTSTPSATEYLKLATNQICPVYTMQSSAFYGRCLPSLLVSAVNSSASVLAADTSSNQTFNISDLSQPLNYNLISRGAAYVTNLLNIKGIAQYVLEDFVNSWVLVVVLLGIATVLSFIYIVILRWILGN
jgi:hypothetical protein